MPVSWRTWQRSRNVDPFDRILNLFWDGSLPHFDLGVLSLGMMHFFVIVCSWFLCVFWEYLDSRQVDLACERGIAKSLTELLFVFGWCVVQRYVAGPVVLSTLKSTHRSSSSSNTRLCASGTRYGRQLMVERFCRIRYDPFGVNNTQACRWRRVWIRHDYPSASMADYSLWCDNVGSY